MNLGLSETIHFRIAEHVNMGKWLVSATVENTTSSVEILVSRPVTPSFNLNAIFPKFIDRDDKMLPISIETGHNERKSTFGIYTVAIGQITEQEVKQKVMRIEEPTKEDKTHTEKLCEWESGKMKIAGRAELNYNLSSSSEIDVTKALAIRVYIQVTDLASGQERVVRHVIPVFTHGIMYDIEPLAFCAGMKNEFEVIAKRPDGKPNKMENMIVTVQMMLGDKKSKHKGDEAVKIKDVYTRYKRFNKTKKKFIGIYFSGRNDIGFFNVDIPKNCIGVLMKVCILVFIVLSI
jgi:hypothetical protein